jgi:hypothetical protein
VAAGAAMAALSPTQYRQQANAICADLHKKLNGLQEPASSKSEDVVPYFEKAFNYTTPAIQKLKQLSPPASLAAGHQRALGLILQQDKLLHQVLEQIKGGTSPEKAINKADATLTKLGDTETATWKKMGVAECAKGS